MTPPESASPRWITLLTDFGPRDAYIGIMKGVIATIDQSLPELEDLINPWQSIKRKKEKPRRRTLSEHETRKFLEVDSKITPMAMDAMRLQLYTGMRIGELSHLQAKDVGLRRLEIQIRAKSIKVPVWNQTTKEIDVREVQWEPKWYEERIIPIESRLEPILREYQERRVANIYGLYFLGPKGTTITDHISRQIKRLTGKNDVSVHTFRHTHISHALNRWGRHPSVVRNWVGHRDLKTTMQYLHVSVEDLHREAKKTGE